MSIGTQFKEREKDLPPEAVVRHGDAGTTQIILVEDWLKDTGIFSGTILYDDIENGEVGYNATGFEKSEYEPFYGQVVLDFKL